MGALPSRHTIILCYEIKLQHSLKHFAMRATPFFASQNVCCGTECEVI